ncbi:hypothetical protein DMC47_21980 [Nostoc sp. 3335mG]|nr:hypothetical protein DMC47_21980 [Nostoc sp. 3335mG]
MKRVGLPRWLRFRGSGADHPRLTAPSDARAEWARRLEAALHSLVGQVVTDTWVWEMALYGPEQAGHFTDPSLEFVQAHVLELRTADGLTFHISCAQDDDIWVIALGTVTAENRLVPDPGQGTFRTRPMPEFPQGEIRRIKTSPTTGSIQEIYMMIADREVILHAGEVEEHMDGRLTVRDQDECVLIFLDRDAHARTVFNEPLYRSAHP